MINFRGSHYCEESDLEEEDDLEESDNETEEKDDDEAKTQFVQCLRDYVPKSWMSDDELRRHMSSTQNLPFGRKKYDVNYL